MKESNGRERDNGTDGYRQVKLAKETADFSLPFLQRFKDISPVMAPK